ncbi:MAG: hypothetical protein ACE5DZ_05375, partial [Mariprofundus sp.]
PKLLTGSTPRIGSVNMAGVSAVIRTNDHNVWQDEPQLRQIWQAATSLTLRDGQIKLYLKGTDAPPVVLSEFNLQQQLHASVRSMAGSARLLRGTLNWTWHTSPEMQQSGKKQSEGELAWQALDASQLAASLALQHTEGQLNGGMTWHLTADGNKKPSLHVEGNIHLNTVGETSHMHSLQWVGTKTDDLWSMDIDADAWPLDPWSGTLPAIGGRQLISAQLDSTSHWQGRSGHWRIHSSKGFLQDVIYARPTDTKQSGWYWSRINYSKADIDTAQKRLRLSDIDLMDSRLVLQAGEIDGTAQQTTADDVTDAENITPALPEKNGAWDIHADRINIHNMMLALSTPQGKVALEALEGKAQSPKGKPLSFKLHTAKRQASTSPDESSNDAPQWTLSGKAEKNSQGELHSARFDVSGKHIPITRLRPLMPLPDDTNSPAKLAGTAAFKAKISVSLGSWQMLGKAAVRDFKLSHGGDTWQTDELNLRFGPVGTGLKKQRIQSMECQTWQYTAALHPLSPQSPAHAQNEAPAFNASSWWATILRNNQIEIDHLNFKNGTVSVGQQQSIWADQVNLEIDSIKPDHWSDISISGNSGGGDLHLKGQWEMLSDEQRFKGKMALSQAVPFFLHNWMIASGMPRLIRGRLSANLNIADGKEADSYQSAVKIQLLRGLAEKGLFPSDPMLARTGHNTSSLLHRLDQGTGIIRLQYDLSGSWTEQPLDMERLGLSIQASIQQALESAKLDDDNNPVPPKTATEARIRLHNTERLSQNERIRLFKVVRKMRRHPDMTVELRGTWTGNENREERAIEIQRILQTQQLIERYMVYRNINRRRIFPIWPSVEDPSDETGSVQLISSISPSKKIPAKRSRH